MPLSLTDFAANDTDYVAKMNANNSSLESFVNALAAAVSATTGEGAVLLQDIFDRPGVVGAYSYVLDVDAYAGGDAITVGRRPAPFAPPGELNVSIAWGLFGGEFSRVTLSGDLAVSAAGIIAGLPKTIYMAIPSSGTPQFYELDSEPNVIMLYSMTWDGVDLSDFRRMAHILPGYTLIQSLAAAPKKESTFDTETDWVDAGASYSSSAIVLPGAAVSNLIDIDGAVEILGFFIHVPREDDDGFSSAEGLVAADSLVTLSVRNGADDELTESDFEIDCTDPVGTLFKGLNAGIGDLKFIRTATTLRLKLTSVGTDVISARCFTWGVWTRPLLGANTPKDNDVILQV